MTTIQLTSHSLTIAGFQLTYTANGQTNIRTFDPQSTCALFEDLKIIEGFDQDHNGEPVVLFTHSVMGQPATGFAFWHEYVKYPHICTRMAQIIAERLEGAKEHRQFQAKVVRLLQPLQAA